jgi:hypothetical protein
MQRIVIYGYAVPQDPYRGQGSGTLIDLTYLVDEDVTVEEILNTINRAGCKFIVKRNPFTRAPEADRVDIQHINVGMTNVPGGNY